MSKKTIEKILKSKHSALDKCLDEVDAKLRTYESLILLRDKIATETFTDELHKFLNFHGELESILVDLPMKSQVPTSSLEDLRTSQLAYVDTAIEGAFTDIKEAIKKLFHHFFEWLKDWFYTNRRLRFYLIQNITRLKNYRMHYGDPASFEIAKGNCYMYSEWDTMMTASEKINDLMSKVPETGGQAKYFVDHFREFSSAFEEFGYEMTDCSIVKRDPKYLRRLMFLGQTGAKWVRDDLINDCERAMANLKSEEQFSAGVSKIQRSMSAAINKAHDPNDLNAMKWFVYMCKISYSISGSCARGVLDVCSIARRES